MSPIKEQYDGKLPDKMKFTAVNRDHGNRKMALRVPEEEKALNLFRRAWKKPEAVPGQFLLYFLQPGPGADHELLDEEEFRKKYRPLL